MFKETSIKVVSIERQKKRERGVVGVGTILTSENHQIAPQRTGIFIQKFALIYWCSKNSYSEYTSNFIVLI